MNDNRLEDLLAEALAAADRGGDAALQAFLASHPQERPALERGLARCRQLGMLGSEPPVRSYPERLGEFRLLRRLGSGGMGVVFEAEQESLGRRVALKLVRPELLFFEGARERFRREIDAVARLSHPSVVRILASGEQDGVPWYAMELLPGRTAQELCVALAGRDPATLRGDDLRRAVGLGDADGTDPLAGPWWQCCTRLAHAAALGVRHAHLRGIVHRDIKPSNVMLTSDGRVVLLDFGVARVHGQREFTRSGQTPGSPAFMSPEQLRGEAVDERTDVYSLGATLWQLLTLQPPFRGDADLRAIHEGAAPALRVHNRDVPRELALVVQKAMDRDRDRRYPDVEAFAEDLDAVLHRRPIRARGLGPHLRALRWCQRHRVVASVLATLLMLALALPSVFAWRERGKNRELAEAAAASHASLQTTLDAIYSLLVHASDDRLRYVPAAAKLSLELMAEACTLYRDLLRRHPDDPRLRANAGESLDHYALRLAALGDETRARALLQECVQLFGGDGPQRPALLLKRALAHMHLGDLAVRSDDRATVQAAFDRAERDLGLAAAEPALALEIARLRVDLDLKRTGLLDPQLDTSRMEAACKALLAAARAIAERPEATDQDRRQWLLAVEQYAILLSRNDREAEAITQLDGALQEARALPDDARIWPPAKQVVASLLHTLGNALVRQRDRRAIPVLKECLDLRERAVADQPDDVLFRSELGASLHALANLNFFQAQDELAIERIDRAIALQRRALADLPTFTPAREYLRNHLTLRGATLARLDRAAELHQDVQELTALGDDRAAQRSAARLWLRLAALRDGEAAAATELPVAAACRDHAMQCLLRADRLGWGPRNPLGEALYDPLRERPEFRQLQQRVGAREAARTAQTAVSPPSTSNASREMPR